MQGKTHAVIGGLAGASVAIATGATIANSLLYVIVGGISGLIPDWLQINLPGASNQIKGLFGHRGISHWAWTPLTAALFLYNSFPGASYGLFLAFFCGWGSHILLDAFSGGAPAFWPFGRVVLGHVKTGEKLDSFVGGAGIVLLFLTILRYLL